jgi:hypothetical protein
VDYTDQFIFFGFEIVDSHWQEGHLPRAITNDPNRLMGMVQSKNSPALRYAVAGFYTEMGEEIAIATDDIEAGYGEVDGQVEGISIA